MPTAGVPPVRLSIKCHYLVVAVCVVQWLDDHTHTHHSHATLTTTLCSQKHAIVLPQLKKPGLDPTNLSSYRPISNLSFLSKLVERVVTARFISHAEENKLFPDRQSSYRRGHSTETAGYRPLFQQPLFRQSQNSGVRTKSSLRGQGELEAQRVDSVWGSWEWWW